MSKEVLTLREAAEELGICYRTALRWCYAGRMPGVFALPTAQRTHWRVDRRALMKFKKVPRSS